jgi:hypothetical protein
MNKADGVYTAVLTANKVATPVITPTGASHAIGAVAGAGPVVLTSGQTLKVFGKATDGSKVWSDVASALYTA